LIINLKEITIQTYKYVGFLLESLINPTFSISIYCGSFKKLCTGLNWCFKSIFKESISIKYYKYLIQMCLYGKIMMENVKLLYLGTTTELKQIRTNEGN